MPASSHRVTKQSVAGWDQTAWQPEALALHNCVAQRGVASGACAKRCLADVHDRAIVAGRHSCCVLARLYTECCALAAWWLGGCALHNGGPLSWLSRRIHSNSRQPHLLGSVHNRGGSTCIHLQADAISRSCQIGGKALPASRTRADSPLPAGCLLSGALLCHAGQERSHTAPALRLSRD